MSKLRRSTTGDGFTIIEVLIVLAIAGLILLIIFLAVPSLQRNSRNLSRKHYVEYLSAQIEQYKSNHGGQLPLDGDDRCEFLEKYASGGGNPTIGSCDDSYSTDDCEIIKTKVFTICFRPNWTPHDVGNTNDEINIALSHWCNTDPARFGEPASDPITEGHVWPYDLYNSVYVIWTPLEGGGPNYYMCVDNYEGDN